MRPPVPRSPFIAAPLAGLMLFLSCPARAADPAPAGEESGLSVTVRPGESWEAVRGRMFPVQSLKQANPGLDPDLLHPGQVVRAPYVRSDLLARERADREDAGRRLAQTRGRLAAIERERAALEARREAFARVGEAMRRLKEVLLGLIAFAVVLLGCLGVALQARRAAQRHAAEEAVRRRAIESRHEDLRRSLADIETGLQRRMMGLLHLHGGKIITEKELDASVGPVIDLAGELRKKHGRA
jgi:hypothetical protein